MAVTQRASRSDAAERILEAADRLLGEAGFDGVSVQAVADAAGVNKALVFYYFGSKAGLVDRVLERYYHAHLAALQGAFEGGGSLAERLHRVIDAYFDFIASHRRYPLLVQRELASDSHRELLQRNLRPMLEWTERALAEVAPGRGPLAARHFFLTFSGIVINSFTHAGVLGELWGEDPTSGAALAERRAHIHWMADTVLAALQARS